MTPSTRHQVIILTVLSTCIPLSAQPATSPAPDLSTPRAAITALYTAMRAGDLPAAHACMFFADARQAEMFDITFTQMWSPLKLMHAMEARFGEAGRRPFAAAAYEKSLTDSLERLGQIDIQESGTTATVGEKKAAINPSAETELTGIVLRKEGGVWKVVAGSMSDAVSDLPPNQLRMMRGMRDAVEAAVGATSAAVTRGDFKTADEAYADYQSRLQEANRAAVATGAATSSKAR